MNSDKLIKIMTGQIKNAIAAKALKQKHLPQ
jgi:hypothetical protein